LGIVLIRSTIPTIGNAISSPLDDHRAS
jgi:hypothetical protein